LWSCSICRLALVGLLRQWPRARHERHRRARAIAERDPDRDIAIAALAVAGLVLLAAARDERDADHSKPQRAAHPRIVNEERVRVERRATPRDADDVAAMPAPRLAMSSSRR
jgi:hypothetical protein